MPRRRRYNSREIDIQPEHIVAGIALAVIFSIVFVVYFAWNTLTQCVFHFPIRWDFTTCISEQVTSSSSTSTKTTGQILQTMVSR